MALPTNREQFKDYCLRRLGYPVIDINASEEQIQDRIDDALLYYQDYHYDATERALYRHQVTADDITNTYITLPQEIIGVSDILPLNTSGRSSGLFNLEYQIRLNDMYHMASTPLLPFYIVQLQLANLQQMFNGKQPIRYNRHVNKLHIDTNWSTKFSVGDYIVVDCHRIADPDTYPDVWADRWLARYATALIKKQWGQNLTKFEGLQLPGGVQFNGLKIFDDAAAEIQLLEDEMIMKYSLPAVDMVG